MIRGTFFSRAHFKVYGERECLRWIEEAGHPRPLIERYRVGWLGGLMTARVVKGAATKGASTKGAA